MKILIYAHLFPPSNGGMQYSNLEIAKGLFSLNHKIEVIACKSKGAKKFISQLPFPVQLLPKWPFATMQSLSRKGLLNWVFAFWYYLIIIEKIRKFKPDIIFVADETANCFWGSWAKFIKTSYISYCSVPHVIFEKKKSGVRNSSLIRSLGSKINKKITFQMKRFMLKSYKKSAVIIAVSNSTKSLLSKFPELKEKIVVVPRSIDNAFFYKIPERRSVDCLRKRYGVLKDNFVILSVGELIIDKGVDDVLKALSGIEKQLLERIKYIVVGEGPAKNYLKDLANKLKLNNNVIFNGEVPNFRLAPYYDLCDLFILPSRKGAGESFGRVFVEAAARSKPSIGVNDGGMVDVIDEGKTGYLVSAGDIEGIRKRIVSLMANPGELKVLGEKAFIKADDRFTSRKIALELERHFTNTALNKWNKIR